MATINNFRDVPSGGWRYVQPETGMWFSSDTYEAMRAEVKIHRDYKGLSTETLDLDIQRQLCAKVNPDHCRAEPGEDYRPVHDLTSELTTGMVLGLSKAIIGFIATGGKFVEKDEADRRAAICRGCPFNKPAAACSCAKAYSFVEALIPRDRELPGISVCMACGCSLQAKANLPAEVVVASLSDKTVLPPWCWQEAARQSLEGSS